MKVRVKRTMRIRLKHPKLLSTVHCALRTAHCALRLCRDCRAKRRHQSQEQTAKIIRAVQQANVRLAQWHASSDRNLTPRP